MVHEIPNKKAPALIEGAWDLTRYHPSSSCYKTTHLCGYDSHQRTIPWGLITHPLRQSLLLSGSVCGSQVHSTYALIPVLTLPGSLKPAFKYTTPVLSLYAL